MQRYVGRFVFFRAARKGQIMRGILLWFVGIPVPVIILLFLFGVL
jgi:hypothetical protein